MCDRSAEQANRQTSQRPQQRAVPPAKVTAAPRPARDQAALQHSSWDGQPSGLDPQPYLTIPAALAAGTLREPPRRARAEQIYAAHREARWEARQALKNDGLTEGLLKSRKAVLPSEIRRRERSLEDGQRGHLEDTEWQSDSPEQRRRGRGEEAWLQQRPADRGRDRTVQRIKEGRIEVLAGQGGQEERQPRSLKAARAAGDPQASPQPYSQLQNVPQGPSGHQVPGKEQQVHRQQQGLHSAVSLQTSTSHKLRGLELSGPKPKTRTRSVSDIGVSQHAAAFREERAAASRGGHPPGLANGDVGILDTRVSVAQLRHSYLENANRKADV